MQIIFGGDSMHFAICVGGYTSRRRLQKTKTPSISRFSDRSSRELSKSFGIFKKSLLSSEIQLHKVDEISEISRSGSGFRQDLGEIDPKMTIKNIENYIMEWKFQKVGYCSTC